ncbi:MAG: fluoride efflux transporter CrcB [Bacteroidales bacterium]|nr:fluoride efflux transporter CrcB [Bacteroidales bacterium]
MITELLKNTMWIGAGSFIGGAARYLVSMAMKTVGKGSPWGTVLVNLTGCLVIGLLWGFFSKSGNEDGSWALFLTVGICGGFTTFSTFSKEALVMLQAGNITSLLAYVAISVVIGIALVAAGYYLVRL